MIPPRLRSVPDDFARAPLAEIDRRLAQIVDRQGVAIGLAVESGSCGPLPPEIEAFVDGEFAAARAIHPEDAPRISPDAKGAAEDLFRSAVARLGPAAG